MCCFGTFPCQHSILNTESSRASPARPSCEYLCSSSVTLLRPALNFSNLKHRYELAHIMSYLLCTFSNESHALLVVFDTCFQLGVMSSVLLPTLPAWQCWRSCDLLAASVFIRLFEAATCIIWLHWLRAVYLNLVSIDRKLDGIRPEGRSRS
jgi:hypothetical protein